MRKALIPMLASLVLCGAGALVLAAGDERAQASSPKPMMVASLGGALTALPDFPSAPLIGAPADFGPDPRQACDDRYASEVGRMADLETRLHLSDPQKPRFARWKDLGLAIAKRRAAECTARMATSSPVREDPVARMAREEGMLKQRLADLEAERPVLAALYAALTPNQRESLAPERAMAPDHGPMSPFHPMSNLPAQ